MSEVATLSATPPVIGNVDFTPTKEPRGCRTFPLEFRHPHVVHPYVDAQHPRRDSRPASSLPLHGRPPTGHHELQHVTTIAEVVRKRKKESYLYP